MKIFVTSDIHGRLSVVRKIVDFVINEDDIETIVLCGDITADYSCESFNELQELQYKNYREIKELLESTQKNVIFILGNHDVFTVDRSDSSYLSYNSLIEFKDFIALEYTNFYMHGTKREGNEEDMIYRLSKLDINEKSIIISHMPPFKCLDKAENNVNYGSKAIRKMIKEKKPHYFLCGHVHNAFGYKKLYETQVFNSACDQKTVRGWVINLDKSKHEKIVIK